MERYTKEPVKYEELVRGQIYESNGYFEEDGTPVKTIELFIGHVSTVVFEASLNKGVRAPKNLPNQVGWFDDHCKFKTDMWHVNAYPVEQAGLWLDVSHFFHHPTPMYMFQSTLVDNSKLTWFKVVPYQARKFYPHVLPPDIDISQINISEDIVWDTKRYFKQKLNGEPLSQATETKRKLSDKDFCSAIFFSGFASYANMTIYGLPLEIDELYRPWHHKLLVRPSPILFTSIGTPVKDDTLTTK